MQIYRWQVWLGSYKLDEEGSRESRKGTAERGANEGPREKAKSKMIGALVWGIHENVPDVFF